MSRFIERFCLPAVQTLRSLPRKFVGLFILHHESPIVSPYPSPSLRERYEHALHKVGRIIKRGKPEGKLQEQSKTSWPSTWALPPPKPPAERHYDGASVRYIGGSSFLIQAYGINILTDPMFGWRAGPYGVVGPRRIHQCGVSLSDLPPLDLVLISKNTYDTYQWASICSILKRHAPCIVTPVGLLSPLYLPREKFGSCYPLDWGDRFPFDRVLITACPSITSGGRYSFLDWNAAGRNGYLLHIRPPRGMDFVKKIGDVHDDSERNVRNHEDVISIFFAGDTAFSKHFELVREAAKTDKQEWGSRDEERRQGDEKSKIDLSLFPIGGYEPWNYMQRYRMTPELAVQAHQCVGSSRSIGFNHCTFPLGDEAFGEAQRRLKVACEAAEIGTVPHLQRPADSFFVTLQPGETLDLP